ncbi:hypothetical protein O1611_g5916 [Lasiodiplodia mahajangana]|uniref:Uncharacterized protein n=1 Tax=Lasiodiplodia mahajangana TaxID=1108764 RepID=A0ACC2JJY9_9PEZI|nr:hypothetical protein O1611_g5916 [Lasiodiplodia mahajangana]
MYLIQELRIDSLGLDMQLSVLEIIIEQCLQHSARAQSDWILQFRDRVGSSIINQLKEALEMLDMDQDLQCGDKIRKLSRQATLPFNAYSNANVMEFFEKNIENWDPANQSVNLSEKHATVSMSTETETGDVIRINISLETDFESSCNEVANYLLTCSRSIDEVFPRSSTDRGVIRLDTDNKNPEPIILWAGYNVFVLAELLLSETSKSPVTSTDNRASTFHALVEKLFRHILDGCVQAPEILTRPKPQKGEAPDIIHVGEAFSVDVTCEPQCLYDAECDDGGSDTQKLVYANHKTLESQYTFFFMAIEEGQASVNLNFANPKTLNFASVEFKIQVQPRRKTSEAPGSVA